MDEVKSILEWNALEHLLPGVGFTEVQVHFTDHDHMYSLRKAEGIDPHGDSVCVSLSH